MAPNLHLTRSVWHDMEKYLGASYRVNKGNSCNDYKIFSKGKQGWKRCRSRLQWSHHIHGSLHCCHVSVVNNVRFHFFNLVGWQTHFRQGTDEANVYPNTFWMPGTAVQVEHNFFLFYILPTFATQRGSLALSDGDPLTPNWPSLENAYRWKFSLSCLPSHDPCLEKAWRRWPTGVLAPNPSTAGRLHRRGAASPEDGRRRSTWGLARGAQPGLQVVNLSTIHKV